MSLSAADILFFSLVSTSLYNFQINRLPPDVISITWLGRLRSGVYVDVTPLVTPPWQTGNYSAYTITLPYVYTKFNITVRFLTANTTSYYYNNTLVQPLSYGVTSQDVSFPIGVARGFCFLHDGWMVQFYYSS